jgi:hypothetical protein
MLLTPKRTLTCLAFLFALIVQGRAADDTISVDFLDESRITVLRSVADIYELNVAIPQNVPGRTSIKVMHCSWRQIYDLVLKPVGFAWREENGIIKIYDTAPERGLLPAETVPVTSPSPPAPVAEQPIHAEINGLAWTIIGISMAGCVLAVGWLVVTFRQASRHKAAQPEQTTRIVAAVVRIFAVFYILDGIYGLSSLATYVSMYKRSANIPNSSSASLTGMISTSGSLLLHLLVGWILWRAASRIACWILGSFTTNSQPEPRTPVPDNTPHPPST